MAKIETDTVNNTSIIAFGTEFVGEMDLVLNKPVYLFVEKGTSLFKDVRKTLYLIKNRNKK